MVVVPGCVTECTLLQSMEAHRVKLELRNVKDGIEIIASSVTVKEKGIQVKSAAYRLDNNKVEAFLSCTLNKYRALKQGTYIEAASKVIQALLK